MNYSKRITKAAISKRLLVSWCVVAVAFFLIGLLVGIAI